MKGQAQKELVIESLRSDLVAYAQCVAIDASVFPHPSMPALPYAGAPPRLFVARTEPAGEVVGFVAAQVDGPVLAIVGLAVHPTRRRTGVGRALIRTIVASARRRRLRVTLHVSTGNAAAIALYESEGFRVARTLHAFYSPARFPNGGDAFEMSL